jgi:cell division initiation protein
MIDLTPLDVRKKKRDFTKALRGYEPREVDHFLDTVAERLEEVVKLNLSLRERVELLTERLAGQEGRERAVQEALISAQSLKQNIEDQTQREAELLRREAESASETVRRDADDYAQTVKRDADAYADQVRRDADVKAEVSRREAETRAADLRRDIEAASESVRENVKRLVQDRRRELVELNRGRARFLKTFRTLLERELDAVELAESNVPSEELDLDVLKFGRSVTRNDEAIEHAANGAAEAVVAELVRSELAKAEVAKMSEVAPAISEAGPAVAQATPAIPADSAPPASDDVELAPGSASEPEPLPDPLPIRDVGAAPGEERWGVR